MITTVVNLRDEPYDIYIGRPTKWGNPFTLKDGTRQQIIEAYKQYLYRRPELMKQAHLELHGKILGCYCKPHACHGDILARIANMSWDEFEALEERLAIQQADNVYPLGEVEEYV